MTVFKTLLPPTESFSQEDAFLDIETNGLFPNRHKILVGGIITKEREETLLLQYCIEHHNETELIKQISSMLSTRKNIYTFHGTIFEFPFLKYKQKKLLISNQTPYDKIHDLSLAISSFRHILHLPNQKRNTIENHFQIHRKEQIDIQEWTSNNKISEDFNWTEDSPILRHNKIELLSLLELKLQFESWKKTVALYFPPFNCNIYLSNCIFSKNTANVIFLIEKIENQIPLVSFCEGIDISIKDTILSLKFNMIEGNTNKNNTIVSPMISPAQYFKKNDNVHINHILSVSKQILFHLFCN